MSTKENSFLFYAPMPGGGKRVKEKRGRSLIDFCPYKIEFIKPPYFTIRF
jgi:hypothetical protein